MQHAGLPKAAFCFKVLRMKSRALVLEKFGAPLESVFLREQDVLSPREDEVLVQMQMAPIHPADLNLIEGKYGIRPALPCVVGNEGCGLVKECGGTVENLKQGDRVRLPLGSGSWREMACVKASDCVKLPVEVPIDQAAMLVVNPGTAWRMLHDFVELRPSDWILQNAANSAVGQCVIQIAKAKGWRTVNLVRREGLIESLKKLGGDEVILDDENTRKTLKEKNLEIKLGLNAVGGDSALTVAGALAQGGTLVTYGAMSLQPLKLPNGLFIFKDLKAVGFWVTNWYKHAAPAQRQHMADELAVLASKGALHMEVDTIYPLDQFSKALEHAQKAGRQGKILIRISSG
jgi:trans-2-enoyl-CoA reductase